MNTKFNKVLSLIVFYALAAIFMIPTENLAETINVNSAFSQYVRNDNNQWKLGWVASVEFDGKGTGRSVI